MIEHWQLHSAIGSRRKLIIKENLDDADPAAIYHANPLNWDPNAVEQGQAFIVGCLSIHSLGPASL